MAIKGESRLNNIIRYFETRQFQLFQREFVDQMDDDWTVFMAFDLVSYIYTKSEDTKSEDTKKYLLYILAFCCPTKLKQVTLTKVN